MKWNHVTVAVAIWVTTLFTSAAGYANLIITNPAAANHRALDVGRDGDAVLLFPDPAVYLAAGGLEAGVLLAVLNAEFPPATGWTFALGPALNGTLNIDRYLATVFAEHRLGAEFQARYTRAATDPAVLGLRWVHLVDTNRRVPPLFIDPPGNDPEPGNPPFYWTEAEHLRFSLNRTPNPAGPYDLWFNDFPQQSCRAHPDNWFARFRLFLTSYTPGAAGVPGAVTLHDGVRWGYDAQCVRRVPEPDSLLLALIGLGLAIAQRLFRKRRL